MIISDSTFSKLLSFSAHVEIVRKLINYNSDLFLHRQIKLRTHAILSMYTFVDSIRFTFQS